MYRAKLLDCWTKWNKKGAKKKKKKKMMMNMEMEQESQTIQDEMKKVKEDIAVAEVRSAR